MSASWSADALEMVGAAEELNIAVTREDGTIQREVPIWVVRIDAQLYVRTWHRRDTGWFGCVIHSRRARISVPGLQADVVVTDVGTGNPELRAGVDAAYRAKYARYGDTTAARMVGDDAAASTLRLDPAS